MFVFPDLKCLLLSLSRQRTLSAPRHLHSPKSFLKAVAACLIPSLFSVLSETDAAPYAVILLH